MNYEFTALPLSYQPITGAARRNRTLIRRVEAYCIVHYTIAANHGAGDWIRTSNVSNVGDFKSPAFHQFRHSRNLLVEDVGIEPTDPFYLIYSLANCCITVLPIFLNWCVLRESNSHSDVRSVV